MLKIGLFGAGHLGKIHLKCLAATDFEVVGFFDPDEEVRKKVSGNFNIKAYDDPEKLMSEIDAVDIVATTSRHYDLIHMATNRDLHIFVEKPFVANVEEARKLSAKLKDYHGIFQIGHVERYNPVYKVISKEGMNPGFIEGHRLCTFNPRGNDVSVILDLMIHDLDLVLDMIDSPVSNVEASGVCVVSSTHDICNARITFENGCTANLTASRISLKSMRKLRVFQKDMYVSMDFNNKESQLVRLSDFVESGSEDDSTSAMYIGTDAGKKRLTIEIPDVEEGNAIQEELQDFYRSAMTGEAPKVGLKDGLRSMELAYLITQKLDQQPLQ